LHQPKPQFCSVLLIAGIYELEARGSSEIRIRAHLHRLRKKSLLHLILCGAAPGTQHARFWRDGVERFTAAIQAVISDGFSRWGKSPSRSRTVILSG